MRITGEGFIAAVPAVGLAVIAVRFGSSPAGGWTSFLPSLAPLGIVLVTVPIGLALLMLRGDRALRTHRFKMDPGGAPGKTIDHELAHVEVGNRHGGRTVAGRVYADGSGWVEVRMPRRATLAQNVAVDMAGARGEGANFWTSPHAQGDRANAAARVAHLPSAERDAVYREAERMSAPGFWHAGSGSAVRRALKQTGSYG